MRPAFSSTKSAAVFALVLLVLLALPVVVGKNLLPPREQAYQTKDWGAGPYPWLHHVIFEEKGEIDIAFIGSSHMFRDLDTPFVQAALSKKLGRPAVVRTIAWGGAGYDALYFTAKDLLENRKVRWLVFYDEINPKNVRNVQGTAWFRFRENYEDIAGLSFEERCRFYLTALVGMPRNLLGLIRPNLPAELYYSKPQAQDVFLHAPNPATRLGSFRARAGFNGALGMSNDYGPFVPFSPSNEVSPEAVCVYSPATKTNFLFASEPLPAWQVYFARKLAALSRQHDTRLMMLHLPVIQEMRSSVIPERACWPELLDAQISLMGIPPAKLFASLSDDDVRKLYSDYSHFNQNGMEFFTRLVTPAILQVYDEAKP